MASNAHTYQTDAPTPDPAALAKRLLEAMRQREAAKARDRAQRATARAVLARAKGGA